MIEPKTGNWQSRNPSTSTGTYGAQGERTLTQLVTVTPTRSCWILSWSKGWSLNKWTAM